MANLIEFDGQQTIIPEHIKTSLKFIFRSKEFVCKNIEDKGRSLIMYLQPSKTTYRLGTVWEFKFSMELFILQISFYNSKQDDLLRAFSHRMKIELSILTNIVNRLVQPSFCFFVDCQSGALKLASFQSWSTFYTIANSKENIFFLIKNFFAQINKYDDLMRFIEPSQFYSKQMTAKQKTAHEKINRFRTVLKGTRNARRQIQGCFADIIRMQERGIQINDPQLMQIKNLYMKNVIGFQKSVHGLQKINQNMIDEKQFAPQLTEVTKNQIGVTHFHEGNKQKMQQILYGLVKIEADEKSQERVLSQEGAHAQIFRNHFKYTYIQTIYDGTAVQFTKFGKTVKGELTYKICNKNSQSSINSFNNQIKALDYMRSMYSPFIAKYYMEIKKKWNENDMIYMNNYKQNVHTLIQNCNSFSLKTRLDLAYKIAKGLCFLYSKQLVHRDFKPQNIVVDSNLTPKIIDFGSSISHFNKNKYSSHDQRLLTTQGYNIQYYSLPNDQQQTRDKYTKREYDEHPLFDVYGFGRTLSYIFFNNIVPPLPQGYLSSPLFDILDHIIFLIHMCLKPDPEDRPGFGELTAFLGALAEMLKQGNLEEMGLPEYENDNLDF